VLERAASSPPRPYEDYRTFRSADGGEMITLVRGLPDRNMVAAIVRVLELPDGLDQEALKARLAEKYGEPDGRSKSSILWTASEGASRCGVSTSWGRGGLRFVENPDERRMAPQSPVFSVSEPQYGKAPAPDLWQGCGPTVSARILSSRLEVAMYDLGAYRPGFLSAWGVGEEAGEATTASDLEL